MKKLYLLIFIFSLNIVTQEDNEEISIDELRNKDHKFLDPGCGNGYISIYLYYILFNKLKYHFES